MRRIALIFFVFLVACDSKREEVVETQPELVGPSEFMQKVDDRSVSLLDWKNANKEDRSYFLRIYTLLHLGLTDNKKQRDLNDFIVYTVRNMEESTKAQGWSRSTTERYLNGVKLFNTSQAGARVMGWPGPKSRF